MHHEKAGSPIVSALGNGRLQVVRNPEVDYILDLVLDEARRLVQARQGNFYLFNSISKLEPFLPAAASEQDIALCEDVIQARTSRLIPENPALCVYMTLQEGDLGVLLLREPAYFDQFYEADLALVQNLAATFAILLKSAFIDQRTPEVFLGFKSSLLLLLENAHLNHKIKESDHQLKSVLEVSNLINSSRELSEMIQTVLYSAKRVIRAESASLFLVDEKTGELYFEIIAGNKKDLKGFRIPRGQGIAGITAATKKSLIVNDAQNDARVFRQVDQVSREITRNILAAPLLIEGEAIGVIEVINTIDRPAFSEHDLEIFESFSDSVAIALQRRRLLDSIQRTNVQLERRLREITSLHAVARAQVEERTIQDLFARALNIVRDDLKVGRASILMASGSTLKMAASAGTYDESDATPGSLAHHVFSTNRPVFIEDFRENPEFAAMANPHRYDSRSCIILPLASPGQPPFGVLCLAEPSSGQFLEEDYKLLLTIASQIVKGYENLGLNEQIIVKKSLEKEMEITSRIQRNILPIKKPQHLHLDLAARSVMAKTTGGDFFDYYVHTPNGDVSCLVADVSGKSLPAALFMAVSSSILRTIIRQEIDPTRVLAQANDLLFEESQSGMFVTVFLCRYDPSTGRLRYASAGHNEMILMHENGNYEMLSGKGSPLGVLPAYRQKYLGGSTQVRDGDLLILYTDGVIEAVNSAGEEFGMDRLMSTLHEVRDRKPEEIVETVYKRVIDFSGSELQYDDFTMLVSRFFGTVRGKSDYHIALPARVESVPALRDFVLNACQRHGLAGQDLEDLLLVSDEAATNIVLHAYRKEDDKPTFDCDLEIEAGSLFRIQLRDQGIPFKREEVPGPDIRENMAGRRRGGFGVYLIKSLMDSVEYHRKGDTNFFVAEKILKKEES
ncbi:MAG: SpoIIE family protein phosphatase [Leptospirales bacterium]|nr:SpoIIE family protein phosphatase [Leptospirales bacterium]HNN60027.1 SpoIIE family protein phosphatase [Leptospiraceae bacterium]HNN76132.1 SpoIIE family protein phosphatase [Leptospiraceae bacterium]